MTAYYVLQITDLSDPHNHRYSTVHPSNWDEGEGLVAAHAADHGYQIEVAIRFEDYTKWTMRKSDGEWVAWADLERVFL